MLVIAGLLVQLGDLRLRLDQRRLELGPLGAQLFYLVAVLARFLNQSAVVLASLLHLVLYVAQTRAQDATLCVHLLYVLF